MNRKSQCLHVEDWVSPKVQPLRPRVPAFSNKENILVRLRLRHLALWDSRVKSISVALDVAAGVLVFCVSWCLVILWIISDVRVGIRGWYILWAFMVAGYDR